MKNDFFALYDALIEGVDSGDAIRYARAGERWALVETKTASGMAMFTDGHSIPPMFSTLEGLSLSAVANAVKSWNLEEASFGLAAANAYYNTPERVEDLGAAVSMDVFYTDGIDLQGRTVGIIGHMHGPRELREKA